MCEKVKLERVGVLQFYERDGAVGFVVSLATRLPHDKVFRVQVWEDEGGELENLHLESKLDVTPLPDKTAWFMALFDSVEQQGELFT